MAETSPGGVQARCKLRVQPRAGSERPEQSPQSGPRPIARHVGSACRRRCSRHGKSPASPRRARREGSGFAGKPGSRPPYRRPLPALNDAAIETLLRWRRMRTVDAFDASPHDSDRLPSGRMSSQRGRAAPLSYGAGGARVQRCVSGGVFSEWEVPAGVRGKLLGSIGVRLAPRLERRNSFLPDGLFSTV
jgi:hypothetical protein